VRARVDLSTSRREKARAAQHHPRAARSSETRAKRAHSCRGASYTRQTTTARSSSRSRSTRSASLASSACSSSPDLLLLLFHVSGTRRAEAREPRSDTCALEGPSQPRRRLAGSLRRSEGEMRAHRADAVRREQFADGAQPDRVHEHEGCSSARESAGRAGLEREVSDDESKRVWWMSCADRLHQL